VPQPAGAGGRRAVPTEVFYDPTHAHLGRHLVRFAFCTSDAVLGEAVERLAAMGREGTPREDRGGSARHRLGRQRRQRHGAGAAVARAVAGMLHGTRTLPGRSARR
jgi:hypothetical protein